MEPASPDSRARAIADLSRDFAAQLDIDRLLPLVIGKCRETLDVEGVSVLLLDRERNELYFPYQSEADPEVGARLAGQRFPADLGIAGSVFKSGRAERVDEPSRDPRFYPEVDRHTGITTRSILAAPLIARGETVGVIEAVNHRGGLSPSRTYAFSSRSRRTSRSRSPTRRVLRRRAPRRKYSASRSGH